MSLRKQRSSQRGQIMVEFLFVFLFFMMLVGFVRTFVYFELDVFNQTNVARYKILKYIRGTVGSESFGTEHDKDNTEITGKSFQKITSWNLRPIPFLLPRGHSMTQTKLPERELTWRAGTKYNWVGAYYYKELGWIPIIMMGFTV